MYSLLVFQRTSYSFIKQYYEVFVNNPSQLDKFYLDDSYFSYGVGLAEVCRLTPNMYRTHVCNFENPMAQSHTSLFVHCSTRCRQVARKLFAIL
jgi:hypothetical protein